MPPAESGSGGRGPGDQARSFWRTATDRLRRVFARGPEPGLAAGNQEPDVPGHLRDPSDGTTVIGSAHMGTVRSRTSTAVGFVDADLYDLDGSIARFNAFLAQQEEPDEQGYDAPTPSSYSSSDRAPSPDDPAFARFEEFLRERQEEHDEQGHDASMRLFYSSSDRAPSPDDPAFARFEEFLRERQEREEEARRADAPTPSSYSSSDRDAGPSGPADDAARQAIRQGPEAFFQWREAEIARRREETAHRAADPAPSSVATHAPNSVEASIARFDAIGIQQRQIRIAAEQSRLEDVQAARRRSEEQEQKPGGPGLGL